MLAGVTGILVAMVENFCRWKKRRLRGNLPTVF